MGQVVWQAVCNYIAKHSVCRKRSRGCSPHESADSLVAAHERVIIESRFRMVTNTQVAVDSDVFRLSITTYNHHHREAKELFILIVHRTQQTSTSFLTDVMHTSALTFRSTDMAVVVFVGDGLDLVNWTLKASILPDIII